MNKWSCFFLSHMWIYVGYKKVIPMGLDYIKVYACARCGAIKEKEVSYEYVK